ncbi:MAG TPA: hypothetical protein VN948_03275 [Terriglobales bacterium]|nr:hypothetical protein [Terriglobales bacterium]
MKFMTLWQLELVPWYAFFLYFAISLFWVKPTRTREDAASRIPHLVFMISAAVLMFTTRLRIGPLGARFLAQNIWVQSAGILLTPLEPPSPCGRVTAWASTGVRRSW